LRLFRRTSEFSAPVSYLESSFLTVHAGWTKRATLERSIRGAVLIGCSKTMEITGTKSETHIKPQDQLSNQLFFQISSIFFCTNYVWQLILVVSFPRAPVSAAYNMFSPVNIFIHKNFPISFLKLRIAGQSVVRCSFSSVIIRTQRTGTIPMPSFRVSRHLYAIKQCTSVRQNR